MSTPSANRGGASGRRTVLVALVGASGVLGSLFYKQGQASRGNYAVAEQVVPDMAPALQEARMKKAQDLREKWKKWALEHQDILKKMLSGGQSEQEVVWQALPLLLDNPKANSIVLADVNDGLMPYTWEPIGKGVLLHGRGLTSQQREQEKALTHEKLERGLQQFHDIKISMSRNAGAKTLGVWASGRITETETVRSPYESGKPVFREETRELVPPYDFLTK